MSQVLWTASALADLRAIRAYIAQFNPGAAREVADSLIDAGDRLADFPNRGRPVPRGTMRELIADTPYIIRYRIDGDVVVMCVRHAARRPTDP